MCPGAGRDAERDAEASVVSTMGVAARLRHLYRPAVKRSLYVAAGVLITLALLLEGRCSLLGAAGSAFRSTTHRAADPTTGLSFASK